jgi:hypothetical protein
MLPLASDSIGLARPTLTKTECKVQTRRLRLLSNLPVCGIRAVARSAAKAQLPSARAESAGVSDAIEHSLRQDLAFNGLPQRARRPLDRIPKLVRLLPPSLTMYCRRDPNRLVLEAAWAAGLRRSPTKRDCQPLEHKAARIASRKEPHLASSGTHSMTASCSAVKGVFRNSRSDISC